MTIDELARRADMTARNIREWQTNGLLPPPERRGRVGIYTDDHTSRIERIKVLRAEGFPLDIIRRMLDRAPESAPDLELAGIGGLRSGKPDHVDRAQPGRAGRPAGR